MSFADQQQVIKQNDTVILYCKFNQYHAIQVKPTLINKHGKEMKNVFQTSFGALEVSKLIGQKFGSKVHLTKGFIFVLFPTPALWTLTMPHRTQILFSRDISVILGRLNIGPGSRVCEAGTGTGSLSHAIMRTIGPSGHLYTADFHQQRALAAEQEFSSHGFSDRVTVVNRDVCALGWPAKDCDAVFLDLPSPWEALHHAVNAIKESGGRICSFSPCVEQVTRTVDEMDRLHLTKTRIFECLTKEYQTKNLALPTFKNKKGISEESGLENGGEQSNASKKRKLDDADENDDSLWKRNCIVPLIRQQGHTGYLIFTYVPPGLTRPAPVPEKTAVVDNEKSTSKLNSNLESTGTDEMETEPSSIS